MAEKMKVDIEFAGDGVDYFDYDVTFEGRTERMEVHELVDIAEELEALAKQIRETVLGT